MLDLTKQHMKFTIQIDDPEAFRGIVRNAFPELFLQPTSPKEKDELLTIDEACEEFGISKTTLGEWKKRGIVPFIRLGRRIYFERTKLLEAGRGHTKYQRNK